MGAPLAACLVCCNTIPPFSWLAFVSHPLRHIHHVQHQGAGHVYLLCIPVLLQLTSFQTHLLLTLGIHPSTGLPPANSGRPLPCLPRAQFTATCNHSRELWRLPALFLTVSMKIRVESKLLHLLVAHFCALTKYYNPLEQQQVSTPTSVHRFSSNVWEADPCE